MSIYVPSSPPGATSAFQPVSNNGAMVPTTAPVDSRDVPEPHSSEEEEDARPRPKDPPSGSPRGDETEETETEDGGIKTRFDWPNTSGYDERRQLLGTEEESSERPSSEDEDDAEKNPWNITREQLNYYTTQFFSMQPNPTGVIPGSLAKEFFEKSRLPITELRQIWQLSDETKDGSLSLAEFLTAMHLVVLRRNDLELPAELPMCLRPMKLRERMGTVHPAHRDRRHNRDLYNNSSIDGDELLLQDHNALGGASSLGGYPKAKAAHNKSCSSDNNSIASPGPKPVNFDFHQPDLLRRNPNIVQPVAVRLSPESPVIPTSEDDEAAKPLQVKQGRREVVYEQLWNQEDGLQSTEESLCSSLTLKNDSSLSRGHRNAHNRSENSTDEEEIDESTEVDGVGLTLSPESPISSLDMGPVSLPPPPSLPSSASGGVANGTAPPLPVRPQQHARSSSLDLKQFRVNSQKPPQIPPRMNSQEKVLPTKESRSFNMNIQQYKEKNSVIARTINELHQEVSDALEERIALEFQLEQLKSFGD